MASANDESAEALLYKTTDSDADRLLAVTNLARSMDEGSSARVALLISATEDRDKQIRNLAKSTVARHWANRVSHSPLDNLRDERAVDALIAIIGDPDARVRIIAIEALRRLNSSRSVGVLIRALDDTDEWVQKAAEAALVQLGPEAVVPLVKRYHDDPTTSEAHTPELLSRIGSSATVPLGIMLLSEGRVHPEDAASILVRLADADGLHPEVFERVRSDCDSLLAATEDDDRRVRFCAARAIGAVDRVESLEILTVALHSGDDTVRRSAAEAILNSPTVHRANSTADQLTVDRLERALNDEDDHVQMAATIALASVGKTEDYRVYEVVIRLLGGQPESMQRFAARVLIRAVPSLANGLTPRALEILKWALWDLLPEVRAAAALLLGRARHAEVAGRLLELANMDSDPFVQRQAGLALFWLGPVDRKCKRCGASLNSYNYDDLCYHCQEKSGVKSSPSSQEQRPGYIIESREAYRRRRGT